MSELKFKLTTETKINAWGIKLFRIEATVDFKNGSTQIKSGDKGGWVESEKTSNGDARVSGNAWVYGDAEVYGDARVSGDAWVSGNARVYGDARVSGNARVYGDARVSGNAWVYGDAEVYGNARVSGNAWVYGDARVYGDAWVYGDAEVSGDAWVSGNARVYGNAEVSGDAWVSGNARVYGDARVSGNARVYGNAEVSLKKAYTKGNFVYSSDSDIVSTVINQSGEDRFDSGRDYKNHLVVGDYEINDIEPENATENTEDTKTEGLVTIQIGENGFSVPESTAQSFRDALSSALGIDLDC